MIWRALALFGALTCGSYVYRLHGENAASAVFSGLFVLLLALAKIDEHLTRIEKQQAQQLALLSKILKGYVS